MFSLIGGLPSTLSASAGALLFEPFIGTTPLSDSSLVFTSVLWTMPSRIGLLPLHSGTGEVSRFSCMLFLRVRGVYDYGGLD